MRLRWLLPCIAALAAADVETAVTDNEACLSGDEDVCGHTSLLQTSVQITKHEPAQEQPPGHARAKVHSLASLATLTSEHGSREDAQAHVAFFLANAFMVVAIVGLIAFLCQGTGGGAQRGQASALLEESSDVEVRGPCSFDEDVYMMSIALIVRDWYQLAKGIQNPKLPIFRIGYATALLFITLSMQMALLWCTKAYVTPQQVADIRDSYDTYEKHMYGGEEHTRVLYTGKHRGLPQYFDANRFDTLDDKVKGEVCQIPFSQLKFLCFVLLIWTITCVSQISRCCIYMSNLLWSLPTVSSMMDAVHTEHPGKPRRRWIIVGLTLPVKLLMVFVVFLPWLASTCFLCWLGCRWLAATNSFGDFIANAMALEFILQFKSLMYYAVCSERTKRDLQTTRHLPPTKKEDSSYLGYFNTIFWGALAVVWVYAYVFHFQHVLPEYQWDVHEPCTPYLAGQLKPDAGDF